MSRFRYLVTAMLLSGVTLAPPCAPRPLLLREGADRTPTAQNCAAVIPVAYPLDTAPISSGWIVIGTAGPAKVEGPSPSTE